MSKHTPTKLDFVHAELGTPLYRQCLALRERVLRAPLGLKILPRDLALDEESIHFAALDGERVVGSVSLRPLAESHVKFRQMAVAPEVQKQRIGRQLLTVAEQFAQTLGFATAELNARMSAKVFYDKLGYRVEGEEFIEHTLPHIKMVKKLD